MINRYGAHVPYGIDRRQHPRPLPRVISGYAVYERIGYQGKRIASCSTRDDAQVIVDIMLEANINAWIEEY